MPISMYPLWQYSSVTNAVLFHLFQQMRCEAEETGCHGGEGPESRTRPEEEPVMWSHSPAGLGDESVGQAADPTEALTCYFQEFFALF